MDLSDLRLESATGVGDGRNLFSGGHESLDQVWK